MRSTRHSCRRISHLSFSFHFRSEVEVCLQSGGGGGGGPLSLTTLDFWTLSAPIDRIPGVPTPKSLPLPPLSHFPPPFSLIRICFYLPPPFPLSSFPAIYYVVVVEAVLVFFCQTDVCAYKYKISSRQKRSSFAPLLLCVMRSDAASFSSAVADCDLPQVAGGEKHTPLL